MTEQSTNQPDDAGGAGAADPTQGRDLSWFFRHVEQYQTDQVAAHDWNASENTSARAEGLHPTLLLVTKGRTSGEPRVAPLLYQPCGDGFLVVASKGGTPDHPHWYKNLLADPKCEVIAGIFNCRAVAVTVEGDERELRWEQMVRFWPDYETYQARTERRIPIVKLVVEAVSLRENPTAPESRT
ncbi:nitroreductase/quinone reductase family protein [Ilumatobacter nonamiensis]|uniref:nitroreductase/quinone reductase family protein n=1 Tax=Ilumatobacter nonamiensis TaxID=467093 RepID=UPI00034CD974|nr:nitroreductase/quinone reductase family protein [Ilumatobacter nonamiensis]